MRAAWGDAPKTETYNGIKYAAADNTPEDNGFVKCKHCGRSFNDKAAERHIPYCAEKT